MARTKGSRDSDYEEKRTALLRRLMMRVMRRETERPSLRELAEAAGVSVPTLKHYFGGRAEVVEAVLELFLGMGRGRLAAAGSPSGSFAESVRDFAQSLMRGLRHAGPVRLSDAFAIGMAEGLLDPMIGPAAIRFLVDPAQQALQQRLDAHVARGDMIATDTRAASLMLLSPILVAVLHQDQMGGATSSPLDLDATVTQICEAFIRAFARLDKGGAS